MLGNEAETAPFPEPGNAPAFPQPAAAASNGGGNGHAAPASPTPESPESDETIIGPLLARANLLRMRSQWDEAVAACTEALRRMPESPTACSLLGDIYEAQNKLDDALQWYGMAVEFDPANKTDRAKLDRVVEIQRRALLQEERDAGQRARQAPPRAADAAHRSLQWFDRVFPPGRAESMARLILVICGIIALMLGFATVFVFLGDREEAETPPNVVMEMPPPAPVVVPPRVPPTAPSGSGAPVTEPGKGAGPLSPNRASPAPAASPAPVGDAALLYALGRGLPQDISVSAAQVDVTARQMALALTLPAPAPGEAPAATRERVLRAALTAVNVARAGGGSTDRTCLSARFAAPSGAGNSPSCPGLHRRNRRRRRANGQPDHHGPGPASRPVHQPLVGSPPRPLMRLIRRAAA